MTVAEIGAASWPFSLTAAMAIAGDRIRQARRRRALNGALHELRRPLQALVLSSGPARGPGPHVVRVALGALDDLEREINGGPRRTQLRPIHGRALVQPAVERWRGVAAATRRVLVLHWRAGSAAVMADPDRIAQALDNLIDNALRHGGLRVCVDVDLCAGGVRIAVSDSGSARPAVRGRHDRRHGHGLRIVAGVAAEHGGRFHMSHAPAGTVATLELPLAPRATPVAEAPQEHTDAPIPARSGSPPLRAAA